MHPYAERQRYDTPLLVDHDLEQAPIARLRKHLSRYLGHFLLDRHRKLDSRLITRVDAERWLCRWLRCGSSGWRWRRWRRLGFRRKRGRCSRSCSGGAQIHEAGHEHSQIRQLAAHVRVVEQCEQLAKLLSAEAKSLRSNVSFATV